MSEGPAEARPNAQALWKGPNLSLPRSRCGWRSAHSRGPVAGNLVRPLLAWFRDNARDLPWRRTRDPYAIWISEIMLQQTQVKTVIPYWQRWMRALPGVPSLARARPDKVLKLWEGLGYYTRAANLRKAAQRIVEKHRGRFPERFADVLALPGVGRYTAGAICSIAFDQPTPILDGNVIRVFTRVFGIAGNPRQNKTSAELWNLAERLVLEAAKQEGRFMSRAVEFSHDTGTAERNCSDFNQALMELGAVICTARRPKCPLCPLRKQCVAFRENRTEQLPNPGQRIPSTRRRFVAFVIERNGRFLVRQRPSGVVNARLWEFPCAEVDERPDGRRIAEGLFGSSPSALQPLHQVRHTITRYRITMEVFRAAFTDGMPAVIQNARWCSPAALHKLAFPSAHRKILEAIS